MELSKNQIIEEIKRTATANGGVPLGRERFQEETGISQYEIAKFWPSFGEAQREAGFEPNTLRSAHDREFLMESVVALIREIGRFPTHQDLIGKRHRDSNFPSPGSFDRYGDKQERAKKVSEYAEQKGYADIVALCAPIINTQKTESDNIGPREVAGEVYLFKSGRYYKIGKTSDPVRRGTELRIQLPEKMDLIHSIKTNDPSGVEAYWHRRFETKRMNGEWFDLTPSEVKSFKAWKRIV